MDGYLDSALKLINSGKTIEPLSEITERFRRALVVIHQALGDMAFRREKGGRINKALFEVFTVLVAKLDDLSADIFMRSSDARRKYELRFDNDSELTLATTISTGNLARVRSRYAIVQQYLDDIIYE